MHYTHQSLLHHLSDAILRRKPGQPLLVGIDGRSAAGKTTLADGLATVLHQHRPTLRSSLDDFHPPGHKYRSMGGGYTPESYFNEGYDYATFRQYVLDPFQASGTHMWKPAYWNSYHDCPNDTAWAAAPGNAVVLVDGIFLLHPQLHHSWTYLIWLDIDWETMVERAAERDTAWVGSRAAVIERYRSFWIPMHQYYEERIAPKQYVQCIVDNRDPIKPRILKEPPHQ